MPKNFSTVLYFFYKNNFAIKMLVYPVHVSQLKLQNPNYDCLSVSLKCICPSVAGFVNAALNKCKMLFY